MERKTNKNAAVFLHPLPNLPPGGEGPFSSSQEKQKDKAAPLTPGVAQRKASDPAWSVWVGASAGSGKTKVLADRVTRLLLAGVLPQRILCLTFTRAAAAEMAIRLTQRLSRWAICAEEELDRALVDLEGEAFEPALRARARRLFAQVLACPGGMRIQTIHGFAQEILRRFPLESGLPAHFAVMEESEAQALWQDSLGDLLQSAAAGQDAEAARALAVLVGALGEESLKAVLREATARGDALLRLAEGDGLARLAQRQRETLSLQPGEDETFYLREAAREGAFDSAALKRVALAMEEKGGKTYAPRGTTILAWLAADPALRGADFAAYQACFLTQKGEIVARLVNKDVVAAQPDALDVLGREGKRLESLLERLEAVRIARESEAVLILAVRLAQRYAERKAAQAALDYDDLIARTIGVLSRPAIAPWVLYKLDGGIDHILVDESQDTNPGQWQIVKTLADDYFSGDSARSDRPRTLFVVGDEKQSIFSFQGADPAMFEAMRLYFGEKIRAADRLYDEVPMTVSFRSAPAVLRAVDLVFAAAEVRAGVSHAPVQHQAFRRASAGHVAVWPLEPFSKEKDEAPARLKTPEAWAMPMGYETMTDPAAALAQALAAQIRAWLDSGATVEDRETKTLRPMTAGDILILVQRRGAFVERLVGALKQAAVPVSGVDRMALTQQLGVMDLIAPLRFALLPEDDLTLATILRGPLIGASEEQLMALAIGREGSLWTALGRAAGEPFAAWRDYLAGLAAMADQAPPMALLTTILHAPCPADAGSGRRALARRLGPEAEDPIDELLGAAERFGTRRSPSLQAFLHDLFAAEAQIKREMEGAAGRVRIMTVHASKGLEAPVVILPDATRVPEKTKLPKLLWDEETGAPLYLPRETRCARPAALRRQARDKQMEEYRRLLYVALTRPAERLLIGGFLTKNGLAEESWYSLIAAALEPAHQPEAVPAVGPAFPAPYLAMEDETRADVSLPRKGGGILSSSPQQERLPSWLFAPPPAEPLPPRPLVPSRPSEAEPASVSPQDGRFKRGLLIHRLLQSLPELEPTERAAAARRFLAGPAQDLAVAAQEEIATEILRLLDDPRFAPFFGPESRAEVPIVGLVGERLISGQVDRLALVGGEVWVLDYKTNRPPPLDPAAVPSLYKGQMEAYRAALRQIYPDRPVRCFLLWTYAPRLMELVF